MGSKESNWASYTESFNARRLENQRRRQQWNNHPNNPYRKNKPKPPTKSTPSTTN
jgi:hypothetical protein